MSWTVSNKYIYEIYKGREMHRHYAQTDTVLSICYCSHIATSQIKDIPQICFFFFCSESYGREVEILHFKKCLFKKCMEIAVFGTFLSKKWEKHQKWAIFKSFWKIRLVVLSNAHFLVLWKQSSQSCVHFGTFTPKNGKTHLVPVPQIPPISLFDL